MEKLKTYIALFRGINVGGKNTLKMAALKEILSNSIFLEAQTYIQSGNLIFKSEEKNIKTLAASLENLVLKNFELHISILVVSKTTLKKIILENPFSPIDEINYSKMYISFIKNEISPLFIEEFANNTFSEDKYHITKKNIYTYYDTKYSNSKLNNNYFEKKLHCIATTRNWKTSLKILEMATNC